MKWVNDAYFWVGHLNTTLTRNNVKVERPLLRLFNFSLEANFKKKIIFYIDTAAHLFCSVFINFVMAFDYEN